VGDLILESVAHLDPEVDPVGGMDVVVELGRDEVSAPL